jgi:AcrR family transcriptional regulator
MTQRVHIPRVPPIPLAGGELRDVRHVCGFFAGPTKAEETLLPFIVSGLERGERALHIVDPARRTTYLQRLTTAGIDVQRALDTGQLEVPGWDSVYLSGGRFDRAAVLTFIQEALAAGRSRGFPLTRVIGYMEWTLQRVPGVEDLLIYESEVDVAFRGVADPLICVYDLERHPAGLILQVLAAHQLGIVEGDLRPSFTSSPSPRDRILAAASQLFPRHGIGATGVDALISSAGVAKATFYRHFPSKDDLIVAWLRDGRSRWLDRVRRRVEAQARSPEEVIPMFFEAVVDWLGSEDYRGCPYLNSAVELADANHPAIRVVRDYLSEVEAYLREALAAMGHRDSATLAPQVQALLAGGISLAVAHRSARPMLAARAAALRLIGDTDGIAGTRHS